MIGEELIIDGVEIADIIAQGCRTIVGESHVVVVRTIRRRIAMNIDVGDAHILVVLHEVDGGCNLSQLCSILTEVGKDIALVELEAQVSFTLFGSHLDGFSLWLHIMVATDSRCRLDGSHLGGILILQVTASAEIFRHGEVESLHPLPVGKGLGEEHLLLGIIPASHHQRLTVFQFAAFAQVSDVLVFAIDDNGIQGDGIFSGNKRSENQLLL